MLQPSTQAGEGLVGQRQTRRFSYTLIVSATEPKRCLIPGGILDPFAAPYSFASKVSHIHGLHPNAHTLYIKKNPQARNRLWSITPNVKGQVPTEATQKKISKKMILFEIAIPIWLKPLLTTGYDIKNKYLSPGNGKGG